MTAALLLWLFAAPAQFSELSKEAASAREQNKTEDAIKLYRECVRLRPAWAEGWWYLGTLLYEGDRYGDAEDALKQFVKLESNAAPGWAMLGLSEYETRDYEHSLEHLQRAASLGFGSNPQIAEVS